MGLSVSVATAILFTAFVIVFGIVFGAVSSFQDNIEKAQDQGMAMYEEMKGTSIAFVSVDAQNDTLTLRNDGSETISLQDVSILVNGTLYNRTLVQTSVVGHPGSNICTPGENIVLKMPMGIEGSRIKVTVHGWASIYYG